MDRQNNFDSNLKKIKEQLEAGKRISVMSVLDSVHTLELRHYVAQLRKVMPIEGEWVKTEQGKRYKEYYLKVA